MTSLPVVWRAVLVALVLSTLVSGASAQPAAEAAWSSPRFADPERRAKLAATFPEVEKAFARFRDEQHLPGLVFGVVIDGELAFSGALGLRDVEAQAAADLDSVFRIASMTKSFTALAILKLRDAGRLSLDDPAAKWLPELAGLAYPTRDSAPIRVRDLLTHSAGFPEDNPWGDRQLATTPEAFSRWIAGGIPFSNPPATAFEYSNYGFALLGLIVERASGRRYRDYVDAEILKPLGLAASTWEAASVPPERLAHGYRREDERFVREQPLADGAFGAMGGLYMSGRDLARYVAFQLDAWPPRDEAETGPVRRSSRREMQQVGRFTGLGTGRESPDAPLRAAAGGYGFGLGVRQDCRLRRVVGHSGGLPGYGSNMRWLPEQGVGVFALANLTYAGVGRAVDEALEALAASGGLAPREPQAAPALVAMADAVSRLVAGWDDALAREIAADNLFLDRSLEKRREEVAAIREALGACVRDGALQPENALRGRWHLRCERGFVDAALTLAPTRPPLVQWLQLTPVLPLSEGLQAAAATLAALTQAWDAGQADALLAPSVDRATTRAALAALGSDYGVCHVGEPVSGDGVTQARVRLECARGAIVVSLAIEGDTGRLAAPSFAMPPDTTCVP